MELPTNGQPLVGLPVIKETTTLAPAHKKQKREDHSTMSLLETLLQTVSLMVLPFLDHQDRYALLQTCSCLKDVVEEYCKAILHGICTHHLVDQHWNARIGGDTAFERLSRGAMNQYLYFLHPEAVNYSIWDICLSPDKNRMAALDTGFSDWCSARVHILNLTTKQCENSFSVNAGSKSIGFVGDNHLAVKARQGAVDVWKTTGVSMRSYNQNGNVEYAVHGTTIYTFQCIDETLCIFDAQTGIVQTKEKSDFDLPGGFVEFQVCCDGQYLVIMTKANREWDHEWALNVIDLSDYSIKHTLVLATGGGNECWDLVVPSDNDSMICCYRFGNRIAGKVKLFTINVGLLTHKSTFPLSDRNEGYHAIMGICQSRIYFYRYHGDDGYCTFDMNGRRLDQRLEIPCSRKMLFHQDRNEFFLTFGHYIRAYVLKEPEACDLPVKNRVLTKGTGS